MKTKTLNSIMYFKILMENKKRILDVLKIFGKTPTARISAIAGINYNYLKDDLVTLENEELIVSEKAGDLATYWKITEKGIKYLEGNETNGI